MQTENRLFDDFARVASGMFATLGGLRDEIEARVKERVERLANELDLVPREEFDAVREMAVTARQEQEELRTRLARLEAEVQELRTAAATSSAPKGRMGTGRRERGGGSPDVEPGPA